MDGVKDTVDKAVAWDAACAVPPKAAKRIAELEAENERLREGLNHLEYLASGPQDSYDRHGPTWTSPQGNEYEDTASHLAFAQEMLDAIRALKDKT